jgi:teichuronic acid biosynthesis glycosyltransferase TuaC
MNPLVKVLFVSSGKFKSKSGISPFVKEQGESLEKLGIIVDYFLIREHGLFGYLKNLSKLKNRIKNNKYDLIHAHYGLSGLLCVFQQKLPVIVTFHGGDILKEQNNYFILTLSWFASILSSWNIFVNLKIPILFKIKKYNIIPCGVDLNRMTCLNKNEARTDLNLNQNNRYILFSGAFDNKVKNFSLASQSIDNCDADYKLLELSGYSRNEVALLFNAVDMLLLTSISEGSPQVIKEAMACNCPIVSTDVGDVTEVIDGVRGCYRTSFDPENVAYNIKKAIRFGRRTEGRKRIEALGLDTDSVARKIIKVYNQVLRA